MLFTNDWITNLLLLYFFLLKILDTVVTDATTIFQYGCKTEISVKLLKITLFDDQIELP